LSALAKAAIGKDDLVRNQRKRGVYRQRKKIPGKTRM
jgi:hypothetical protein